MKSEVKMFSLKFHENIVDKGTTFYFGSNSICKLFSWHESLKVNGWIFNLSSSIWLIERIEQLFGHLKIIWCLKMGKVSVSFGSTQMDLAVKITSMNYNL